MHPRMRRWSGIATLIAMLLSAAAVAETTTGQEYLLRAQKALENGQFTEAERYYQTAADQKGDQRAQDVEFARIANNLAVTAEARGQLSVAESYAERAVELVGEAINDEQELAGTIFNSLGSIYFHQERYDDAKLAYLRALPMLRKISDSNLLSLGYALHNLAVVYHRESKFVRAEQLYSEAIEFWAAALGREHPDVASALNHLGALYYDTGWLSKAEPMLREALAIRLRITPEDRPELARIMNNLAMVHEARGKPKKAERSYQQAIEYLESDPESSPAEAARLWANIADLYLTQARLNAAESAYRKALRRLEWASGAAHSNLIEVLASLAAVNRRLENYRDAVLFSSRLLGVLQRQPEMNSLELASALENHASLLRNLGEDREARILAKQANEIRSRALAHSPAR